MKKLILPLLLICTGIIAYVTGYLYIHKSNSATIIKKRTYIMNTNVTPSIPKEESDENNFEDNFEESEQLFILYPMYGEIWIFDSEGNFYDYTDIMLCDLTREEQIDVLNCSKVYTADELYNFLESVTS